MALQSVGWSLLACQAPRACVQDLAQDMSSKEPHGKWPEADWWLRVEFADISGDGPAFRAAWLENKQMGAGTMLQWLLRHASALDLCSDCHSVAIPGCLLPCKYVFRV